MLSWLRLEHPQRDGWRALALLVLAVVPALAPRALAAARPLRRRRARRDRRCVARSVAPPVARGAAALGRLPRRVRRPAPVRPVVPRPHPRAAAARRLRASRRASRSPPRSGGRSSAVAVFIVGATWPATLLTNDRDLLRGAVILGVALFLLAALREHPLPSIGRAALLGAGARRRRARGRDPAGGGEERVPALADVEADLPPAGPGRRALRLGRELRRLHWPRKTTTVFKVQASPRSLYWRSTTLDLFTGARWVEYRQPERAELFDGRLDLTQNDPLAPPAARDPATWKKAQFEIASLADDHLVAPSVPVGYEPAFSGADFFQGGSGVLARTARARPALRRLELLAASDVRAARGDRPRLRRGRAAVPRGLPGHGRAALRHARPRGGDEALPRGVSGLQAALLAGAPRRRQRAEPVRGGARARVVAPQHRRLRLHAASAARPRRAAPRLRRPHEARLLPALRGRDGARCSATSGFPTRVAEGFTSGVYDPQTKTWTVTDHDAHAWVEVWFARYGWLPFDPTPGRGSLSAAYSVSVARLPRRLGAAASSPASRRRC